MEYPSPASRQAGLCWPWRGDLGETPARSRGILVMCFGGLSPTHGCEMYCKYWKMSFKTRGFAGDGETHKGCPIRAQLIRFRLGSDIRTRETTQVAAVEHRYRQLLSVTQYSGLRTECMAGSKWHIARPYVSDRNRAATVVGASCSTSRHSAQSSLAMAKAAMNQARRRALGACTVYSYGSSPVSFTKGPASCSALPEHFYAEAGDTFCINYCNE